jgi:hypothetical protein
MKYLTLILVALLLVGCAAPRSYPPTPQPTYTPRPTYAPVTAACNAQVLPWAGANIPLTTSFARDVRLALENGVSADRSPATMRAYLLSMKNTKQSWDRLSVPDCAKAMKLTTSSGMNDMIIGLEIFIKDGNTPEVEQRVSKGWQSILDGSKMLDRLMETEKY